MLKFIKKFFTIVRPSRWSLFKNEYGSGGFLPYVAHWNPNTLITNNNSLIQIVKINGFSFETADDEDLDIKKDLRNSLLKSINASNLELYFHIIRRKQATYPRNYYNPDMPLGFASYLDEAWVRKHQDKESFVNELYITIVCKPELSLNFINKLLVFFKLSKKDDFAVRMHELQEQLDEVISRIIIGLGPYGATVLELEESENGPRSEPMEFLSQIANCGEHSTMLYTPANICRQLNNFRLNFYRRYISLKKWDGTTKYAGVVSLKEYGPKTWAGMLDGFLRMPLECIITQSFKFTNKQAAINKMQLQQNRMIQSGDKAISQIAEITDALDQAMSGSIAFGSHHLTVLCMADNPKTLESNLSLAAIELTNTGGVGTRETINMEPAFWAQFPGNSDFIVRSSTINTYNLSAFNSLHNYPLGKAKKNHWGDAVTVLDTTSGTPYYFNFHLRDVGHTMVIGPTGAGKTVILNFLCAQSQKFQCRLFFFDKDRGAEIFIRALGGRYTIIDPGQKCSLNPLQMPDTTENRSFLIEWLKYLVSTHGEEITAEDVSILTTAINGNYKLAKKDRKLSNIAPFFGLGGPDTLAGRLAMWHGNGSHAKIFDNDEDMIDFHQSNIFGFEMGELLKDKSSLAPVLSYIFHRINISLTGTPTMIVLDEAWALIDNPVFAPKIKDWLKVLRKLNTFVVFATQSVEDASKSQISDTLIQQTATQIFLPNLKATPVYRTVFMLSEREYALIKTTDPGSRFFLIKQGNDAVIAKIDLSGMDDIINVLSGRADTVAVMDEVMATYGDDPKIWLPKFTEALKNKTNN